MLGNMGEAIVRRGPDRKIRKSIGWMCNGLRRATANILSTVSTEEWDSFFQGIAIREKWIEHLSGRRNWQYHLWNVLMFQAWLEVQKGPC